jgi:hypothetical protein
MVNLEKNSKLLLLLCLHRSGSSATAGVMNLLGIHMGEKLLPATRNNPKGHYENAQFVNLNQEILRSIQSTWNRPPSREKVVKANIPAAKIRTFIRENMKPVWGLKDPRTLLTFEFWKPYFEEVSDITYVFVHRPFDASVRSLAQRDKNSIINATQILTPYLKNLYHYRHTYGLPDEKIIDINFLDLLKNPEPLVRKLNNEIGNPLNHKLDEVCAFLDNRLKHF